MAFYQIVLMTFMFSPNNTNHTYNTIYSSQQLRIPIHNTNIIEYTVNLAGLKI